jgi:hypothetical protein
MPRFLERLRDFWSEHIVGPQLRTYDAACEELGGAPWRDAVDTESWFIGIRPEPPPVPPRLFNVPPAPASPRPQATAVARLTTPPSPPPRRQIAAVPAFGEATRPSRRPVTPAPTHAMPSSPPPRRPAVAAPLPAPARFASELLPTLDSGAIILKKPMSRGAKLAWLGGGALALVIVLTAARSGGAAPSALAMAAPAAAPAVAAVAAPAAPPSMRRAVASNRVLATHLSAKRRVRARHRRR